MEGDGRGGKTHNVIHSPSHSHQTVSDDDEIDYSVRPEFYDSDADGKDETWVHKRRKGDHSDAVLSCPACFITLCLESQRHEKYVTQYRAVFVLNCKIEGDQVRQKNSLKQKRHKRRRDSSENETDPGDGETFKTVCCSICSTEVGVIGNDEVYHFFNVIPSGA